MGHWRSWLARFHGMEEVKGSNPLCSTKIMPNTISSSLDKTFRISIGLKGLDGLLEVIGGLLLLVIKPETINRLARLLTQHELSEDRHDYIAHHVLHSAGHLTSGATLFAAFYLLSHGISKIVLVIAALKQKTWAYPAIIVLLGLFIFYQVYRLFIHLSVGLILLTTFDAFIVWLTWREWQAHKKTTDHNKTPVIS
jgi:uncharacterized membrane protein